MEEHEIPELQQSFEEKLKALRKSKIKSVKAALREYDLYTYKIFECTNMLIGESEDQLYEIRGLNDDKKELEEEIENLKDDKEELEKEIDELKNELDETYRSLKN